MATDNGPFNKEREPLKILVFAASMKASSINRRLAKLAESVLQKHGVKVDFAEMQEFDCASYNGDVEQNEGFPKGADEFKRRLESNDAFLISSPEYNASMPGILKNIIDWASRFRPQPFNEKQALLMSASPSMAGGNRGLWSLRIPLEHLGTSIMPNMFSLAMAHQAFNEDGSLNNASLATRFEENLVAFINAVEAAKHYPCMKKAWVEFLGEQPGPLTERVE